jgi:hypothetical protein
MENADQSNLPIMTRKRLKKKIIEWLDLDDQIRDFSKKAKKLKRLKLQLEKEIIDSLDKLGLENEKIDVFDPQQNRLRGRVYKYRSIAKMPYKEDNIKDALMESLNNERTVNQLVKKIESKRPVKERFYLKRTRGNSDV